MVSVCMATFNGEKFIIEQINSILEQINVEDELIISDDSSTDNTIGLLQSITDQRVKVLIGNKFRDPIKNFQNALSHAVGDYIFLSDQDDVWVKSKYHDMMQLLTKYDLVISDSVIVDEQLRVLHPSFFDYFKSGKGVLKNMVKSSYYGSCMAFKKRILTAALPFPDTKEIGHDLWIGLVAEMIGTVYFYKKPLLLYRRHQSAFTPVNVGKSKRTKKQMIYGRMVMIKEVGRFFIKNIFKWKTV